MNSTITTAVAVANIAFASLLVWGTVQFVNRRTWPKVGLWVPSLLFGLLSVYAGAYLGMLRVTLTGIYSHGTASFSAETSYGLRHATFLDEFQESLTVIFAPANFVHRQLCPDYWEPSPQLVRLVRTADEEE